MHVAGLEQLLLPLWNAWVFRGGRPDAKPLGHREGWLLTLSGRAKFGAWFFLAMFAACLAGVIVLQAVAPQPPRQFWLLLIGFVIFNAMFLYYVTFCHWYRVTLTEDELILQRFLLPTRHVRWREIVRFQPDDDTLRIETETGAKVGIYLSLNGLSAVRRSLAAFALMSKTVDSWSLADPELIRRVPAWRCDDRDLEDNPFAPLGSWQVASYEENLRDG